MMPARPGTKQARRAKSSPSPASVTKEEYETLAAFRYRLRRFLRFSEEAARSAGLTAKQHQALLAVKGFPGREEITVGELAERLQIAHHSAVGLVDRLVSRKLLIRQSGTDDARQVYVSVSARGDRLLERLTSTHKEELRRFGMPLPPFPAPSRASRQAG